MDRSLTKLGEFGLIERLKRKLPTLPSSRWVAGIGDDTSVLRLGEHHYQLFTHDLLLEKIHFLSDSQKFSDLGWKALAVNLSDIAAMGGVPQEAVVGLGIPARATLKQVENLYDGLKACAKKFHCPVVGGDTNRSKGGWVISVAVTGFCGRRPRLRSGARAGDSLWVTGTLGGAALGWRAQQKQDRSRGMASFRKKQCRPEPRLLWGQRLGECEGVTAMMDLSDGLAGDLAHMAKVSGVGFQVELEKLPRVRGWRQACERLKISEKKVFLSGGEDYELLFTLNADEEMEFSQWLKKNAIVAQRIGRAVASKKIVFLEKGKPLSQSITGFRHF